jgi:hypothetical protein
MFALLLIPIATLWISDNSEFLAKVTDAPWQYVGVNERRRGLQSDGVEMVPLQVGDHTFIIFKQMRRTEQPAQFSNYSVKSEDGGKVTASILLPSGSMIKAP